MSSSYDAEDTKGKPMLRCRARRRAEKGQGAIEFALVIPMFFFLIFAAIDFSRMFFVQANIQDALEEAGRYASTGDHLPDPNNPGQTLSRVQSIIDIAEEAAWPGANFTNLQISSLAGGPGSAGGPGDTVTLSLTTSLQLMTPIVAQFFPNGAYTFTSSVTFQNEPFPTSETN